MLNNIFLFKVTIFFETKTFSEKGDIVFSFANLFNFWLTRWDWISYLLVKSVNKIQPYTDM